MTRTTLVAACLAAAALGAGAPLALASHRAEPPSLPDPRAAAATSLKGLPASPAPDAVSAALPRQHPRPGTVVRVAGPFDDRFALTGLTLRRGSVSGVVTVTSDVSEVIELQVVVGFYDAKGRLLGTAPFERHGEDFADVDEHVPFTVAAGAAYAPRVASAALGVPVLVNE